MILLLASLAMIFYVWVAYPLILVLLSLIGRLFSNIKYNYRDSELSVTVIVAAHNEESSISKRINNIFDADYEKDLVSVIVVSDGSIDNTNKICKEYCEKHSSFKLIEIDVQQGRSNAHNIALLSCESDIVIFTDAETIFERDTIKNLSMPFSDKNIGFVSGELRYLNQKKTKITQSASIYWKYEKFLRKLESELRLFVFGTGACCAVRRKLYKPIPLTGDIDFTTPLDVVLQGYICISQNVAIAWDEMPDTQKKEFKSRVRMTSKNLYGTIARWGVLGVFKYPAYSFVIFSHKIGRWLTPFAMIGVFVGSLLVPNNLFIFLLLVAQFLFYSLAVFGYYRFPFPLSGLIYSFCLTNIGFFIGVMKAITGQVPQAYKPINKV